MPLTKEQFRKAREAGYSFEQITEFEKRRNASLPKTNVQQTPTPSDPIEDIFLPGKAVTEEKMKKRIDPMDRLREEVMTPYDFKNYPVKSMIKPFVTGLKTLAVPAERAFAALGGLGVGLQNTEGAEAFKRFKEGLTGEKQYRLFDPMRNYGVPESITTPVELFTEIAAPVAVMNRASKLLSRITKATDARLLQAGDDLLKGGDDAVEVLTSKVNKEYVPVNSVEVAKSAAEDILDDISKQSKTVIEYLEDNVGKIDEFMENFTIEKLRKLKRLFGDIKPSAFGKAQKGADDLISDNKVIGLWKKSKDLLHKTLRESKKVKNSKRLLDADEAVTDAIRANKFVKKTITDPTLLKPTKTGRMASGIAKEGDMTARVALSTLKKAGMRSNLKITKAVEALRRYNAGLFASKAVGSVGRGAAVGASAGLIGGRLIGGNQ